MSTNSATLSPPSKKEFIPHSKFSASDDEQLRAAVGLYGTNDWAAVSFVVPGKNERQCKERWFNYLSPSLCTDPWTPEEDSLLLEKHSEMGSTWVKIAQFFPHRTDAMVKNRFGRLERRASKQRRLQAKNNRQAVAIESPARWDFPTIGETLWSSQWEEALAFNGLEQLSWMD
jgi:hypothetical protein